MTYIVGVDVAVGAAILEILVKSDSGGRARRRFIVTARAAVRRILLVAVDIGRAGAQASQWLARGVERLPQLSWTVRCW